MYSRTVFYATFNFKSLVLSLCSRREMLVGRMIRNNLILSSASLSRQESTKPQVADQPKQSAHRIERRQSSTFRPIIQNILQSDREIQEKEKVVKPLKDHDIKPLKSSTLSESVVNDISQSGKVRNETDKPKSGEIMDETEKKLLFDRIEKENDIDTILNLIVDKLFSSIVSRGLARIAYIYKYKKPKPSADKIFSTPQFSDICTYLRHINNLGTLVDSYVAICQLTDGDIPIIHYLSETLRKKLLRMPFQVLPRLVAIPETSVSTSTRKELYQDAKAMLAKRWVEITTPRDLINLMYLFQKDTSLFEKLEEVALDMIPVMSTVHMYKIFNFLSRQNSRNLPLLKSVVYHMNEKCLAQLDINQCISLVYFCSNLNMYEGTFLSDVSKYILLKTSVSTPKETFLSVIRSFGRLHFYKQEFVNDIFSRLANKKEFMEAWKLSALVFSLAKLNVVPKEKSETTYLMSLVQSRETAREADPEIWLNIVWSMVVLQLADDRTVASVLDESFYSTLPTRIGTDEFKLLNGNLKLMNIDCAAGVEIEGYSGPRFKGETTVDMEKIPMPDKTLVESVLNSLQQFAPYDKYSTVRKFVSEGGYTIDAELYVDSIGKPMPHSEASDRTGGVHRIAVKVLGFHDMTFPDHGLTGDSLMAVRHLKKLGYSVVQVPYHEWSDMTTPVMKVQYLENKILEAISGSS